MKHLLFIAIVALLTQTACSQKKSGSDSSADTLSNANEAVLILKQLNEQAATFPLHDTIVIPLKAVETSSGSYSSVSFRFEVNDGGRVNSIQVFLPAAPKLAFKEGNNGGLTLMDAVFPYTLKPEDYIPYKNALYETEMKPQIFLQSIVKSPEGGSTLYFRITELTFKSFEFMNYKANAHVTMKLMQYNPVETAQQDYSAELEFLVRDFPFSQMLVD
ncbi:hypothetical protein SDC9_48407 [bioreactor metagenome]|uniref:Uncharacterized protein n=1 Tax=bioreactor metagenome TaxID=1076179 RepID=A0A644WEH0_9ZZZZ